MLNKIKLFFLKQKLKKYKRGARSYEKCGVPDSWYVRHGIPQLEREIQELEITIKNPRQKTFCYCPKCNNELISSKSFVSDEELVTYKCTKCGHVSKWDFDVPCPILIDGGE